jgi:ribonucleotide reductase beta subunit family protein with ferritin-like domain
MTSILGGGAHSWSETDPWRSSDDSPLRRIYLAGARSPWDPNEISFEADRAVWRRLASPSLRSELGSFLVQFGVGELTGVDLLAPMLLRAPELESVMCLAGQVAEEARHLEFFTRARREMVGEEGGPLGSEEILLGSVHELEARLGRRLLEGGASEEDWLRAILLYHVLVEGVIGYSTLDRIVRRLKARPELFPGLLDGASAVLRDERRHIAFGLVIMRRAIVQGHESMLAASLPEMLRKIFPHDVDRGGRMQRSEWQLLSSRLRSSGFSEESVASIAVVADAVDGRRSRF